MEIDKLQRNPAPVLAALKQVKEKVIALKPLSLIIPERFIEKGLSVIGDRTYTIGVYALVCGNDYAISRTLHRIEICPSSITTIKHGGNSMVEFQFDKGSEIFPQCETLKDSSLLYSVFDEIILKGNCPWYLGYEDLARLFENADRFAGVSLSSRHAILGMIAASITRSSSDKTNYRRHEVLSVKDKDKPRVTIPLRNVGYGTTNTTSALIGSYWNEGLTSALVNPSERVEKIEELLTR